MTDSVYSTQTVFPWLLTDVDNGLAFTTRVFRFMDAGRAVSLKITVTGGSISALGRVTWVSSGDIQNTRERRFSWEHKLTFSGSQRPSGNEWRDILLAAEGECEQLI